MDMNGHQQTKVSGGDEKKYDIRFKGVLISWSCFFPVRCGRALTWSKSDLMDIIHRPYLYDAHMARLCGVG